MQIDGTTLVKLEDKAQFLEIVHQEFYEAAGEMGFVFHWNKAMAQDAYFQWMQDIERIRSFEERVSEPDHVKKAAHLIYWLRRFSPVNDFIRDPQSDDIPKDMQEFMLLYGREYLAFNFGYQIAKLYECTINDRDLPASSFSLQSSLSDVEEHDFLRSIVHIMKTKMISPQSFVVALKAVFLRP